MTRERAAAILIFAGDSIKRVYTHFIESPPRQLAFAQRTGSREFSGAGRRDASDLVAAYRGDVGRRLGMAVKLENLSRLQAEYPQRQRVVTGNDGTNSWMVNINEALGFRIVELCPAYQRKLA